MAREITEREAALVAVYPSIVSNQAEMCGDQAGHLRMMADTFDRLARGQQLPKAAAAAARDKLLALAADMDAERADLLDVLTEWPAE